MKKLTKVVFKDSSAMSSEEMKSVTGGFREIYNIHCQDQCYSGAECCVPIDPTNPTGGYNSGFCTDSCECKIR